MNRLVSILIGVACVAACGGGGSETREDAPARSAPIETQAARPTAPRVVDACGLLTKAEVESLLHRAVLEGRKDQAATLSTCGYGNPTAPLVNGIATDTLLTVSVLTDELPNQSKGIFEIARTNASDAEVVNGLGDQAFWDNTIRELHVLKGNHLAEVTLGSDLGGLQTARPIMERMLAKLP
jgi:hypothetical protein